MITSEQVLAARAISRLRQKDLAERAGVSLTTIKRLELQPGVVAANMKTVRALVEAFQAVGVTFTVGGVEIRK